MAAERDAERPAASPRGGSGLDPGPEIAEHVSESWRSRPRREAIRSRRAKIAGLIAEYRQRIHRLQDEDGRLWDELARIAHGHGDLSWPGSPEPPPGLTPEELADDDD